MSFEQVLALIEATFDDYNAYDHRDENDAYIPQHSPLPYDEFMENLLIRIKRVLTPDTQE